MKVRSTLRSIPRHFLLGGAAASIFYVALYLSAEPWRVFSNDVLPRISLSMLSDLWFWLMTAAWLLPTFLLFTFIAFLGHRRSFAWCLLLLAVPAFMVSRGLIIDWRYRQSITSCANHSGVWWSSYDYDSSKPLPASTEFHDLLRAFWGDQLRLNGARCPGYRLAGSQTGVIFVGGSLHLDSLRRQRVLIAFCSSVSHPPPHDHQHCLIWEWASVNDDFRGVFRRECTDAADMIQRIETALHQAASGQVKYSSQAQTLLHSELAGRQKITRSSNKSLQPL